jgi:hypothetical protein
MRKVTSANPIMLALLTAFVVPPLLCAQERASSQKPRYRLVDVGTLGGPSSFVAGFNNNLNKERPLLTNCADTARLNPDFPDVNPYLFDPYTGLPSASFRVSRCCGRLVPSTS